MLPFEATLVSQPFGSLFSPIESKTSLFTAKGTIQSFIQLWMLNRQSGVVQSSTCIWSVCVRTRVGFRTHQRNRNIIRFNCLFCVCFGILKLAYEQAHMCDFGEKFWRQFLQGNNFSVCCFVFASLRSRRQVHNWADWVSGTPK